MKNIVLFGGAFDPIHNGHINMALNASKILNADVFFIPAKVSVWKNNSVEINHKVQMINLAISNYPRLYIDLYEANSKEETNYTIDTVKHFKNAFPDANLYLLIGTDQVNKFHLWKEAKLIAKLVHIIYYDRPNFDSDVLNIKKFNMSKIDGQEFKISSTDIKSLKSLDLPISVIKYIIDNNLYFVSKIKSYLTVDRFKHSVEVAKLAYQIAEKNNLKIKYDCFIAGLLHDIGKNIDKSTANQIMLKNYKRYIDLPLPIHHQFISHYLAKNDFEITNEDILNAIQFHTTGNSTMSDMGKIVYAADKIEPTRGFDSKWLINAIEVNLNDGFSTILKDNVKYFESNNKQYKNELMLGCLKSYLKEKN